MNALFKFIFSFIFFKFNFNQSETWHFHYLYQDLGSSQKNHIYKIPAPLLIRYGIGTSSLIILKLHFLIYKMEPIS